MVCTLPLRTSPDGQRPDSPPEKPGHTERLFEEAFRLSPFSFRTVFFHNLPQKKSIACDEQP
jgi:hypothetical protein